MGTAAVGVVGAIKSSKNGKPMVNIGGTWYFAGRCDISSVQVGNRLTFEWSTFGNDPANPLKGIDNWGFDPNQPTAAEIEAAKAAAEPQMRKSWGGKGGGGFKTDRSLEVDLQCMRFTGQIVASLIEHGVLKHTSELKPIVKDVWESISFTRALGGSDPALATSHAGQATNRSAGPPPQTPQGGNYPPMNGPVTGNVNQNASQPSQGRVRPTGTFGIGKNKDVPWNVMEAGKLQWVRDQSTFGPDIKKKADDELFFREQDKQRADAVQAQMSPPENPDDWSDDIPF